ncbi:MAG: hypothetical protein M0006_02200 [Magnetospirillum sp.]|nr:hypothetical protein [Magnetospirillum sp.]
MGPFLLAALQLTPLVVQAGEDIAAFVEWAIKVYNSPTGPADADWDTLAAKETEIRATLLGPSIVTAARAAAPAPADPAPPSEPAPQPTVVSAVG